MNLYDDTLELRGTVTSDGASVDGVRARILLPTSPFRRARMRLFPSSDQEMKQLMNSFKASFEGRRPKSLDGTGMEVVVCRELNMLNGTTQLVSPDIQRSQIQCEPVGIWHSVFPNERSTTTDSHVVFRLTPNRHLGVAAIHTQHLDGSCAVHKVRQQAVALSEGVRLVFDRHFKWATDKRTGVTTRFGFLVGTVDLVGDFHDPDRVQGALLRNLDDLLLLASLASSQRCVCVGWQVTDASGRTSRYDRGGISRPSRNPPPASNAGLVSLDHFQDFLSQTWCVFEASPYKEALRSAVYSIVPLRRSTVESHFLSMFTALEELVLVFRRLENKQFVLPREQWSTVESAIRTSIKTQLSGAHKDVRSMLYDNLNGVNRVPLRRVLEQFVASVSVDVTDLWPMFSGEGDGLGAIRNKLVHGDLDSGISTGSLAIAAQHLSWTLERLVLALLKWPLGQSEVRPPVLAKHSTAMQRLREARAEMTSVLKRRE